MSFRARASLTLGICDKMKGSRHRLLWARTPPVRAQQRRQQITLRQDVMAAAGVPAAASRVSSERSWTRLPDMCGKGALLVERSRADGLVSGKGGRCGGPKSVEEEPWRLCEDMLGKGQV